ncbi:MAG: HGxxPAAW family protein [Microbacterium sp.]
MSNSIEDPGHGESPAAWTAVVIMLVAFSAGTLFFVLEMPVAVWLCAALLVVGLIVGWGMAKAGYGVKGPKYTPKKH